MLPRSCHHVCLGQASRHSHLLAVLGEGQGTNAELGIQETPDLHLGSF